MGKDKKVEPVHHLRWGNVSVNVLAAKDLSKDQFKKLYAKGLKHRVDEAWSALQAAIKTHQKSDDKGSGGAA